MIIFFKKNVLMILLSLILFGFHLNATIPEDLESITAFLRIPAAIGANTLGKQSGTIPKIMVIASDLLRLSNEMLSVMNKREQYDFHVYDYCWGAYDVKNLITHVKNFWVDKDDKNEKVGSEEIKKARVKDSVIA